MQLQLATNIDLDENEKCTYIIHFQWLAKKNENVVVFVIHDVVHGPLDIMWHFIQLELRLQILVANIHVTKCEKNELTNKITIINDLKKIPGFS